MIRVCRPGGRIIMLNHFSNGNKVIAAVEKVISPLTKHLGWRTDLSLNAVLEGTSLQIARKQRVNPLRFWALVECVNGKDKQTNGTAAAHPVAGYVNGNGAATFANGNGNGRYSPEHAH
jgi:phosphatidylethanolamine/phosphatidyl-N-methylethanolamine N-methyltransferase